MTARRVDGAFDWYWRHRYSILLATLFATLVASPLSQVFHLPSRVVELFLAVNLVAAVAGISERPVIRVPLLVLSALVMTAGVVPRQSVPEWLGDSSNVLWVLIAGLAAVATVRFALGSMIVDSEHIAAALSAYLLAGLVFAVLYVGLDHVAPGSIAFPGSSPGATLPLDVAIYFSYVTLATLGYGDIVPKDGAARGLAVVEALGAQLYLTVTVARLVGLHAQSMRRRPE